MSRMASIAAAHRRAHHFQVMMPTGSMVPYRGLVETIPYLPGQWALCDGNGGTTPMADTYAMGKSATFNGAAAADFSGVGNAQTDTQGDHTGGNLVNSYCPYNTNIYTYARALGGGHYHIATILNGLFDPPHLRMAYIQAMAPSPLPADAVVWRNQGGEAPPRAALFGDVQNLFIKGQTGDDRAAGGSPNMTFNIVSCDTQGDHPHNPNRSTASGGATPSYNTNLIGGAHDHSDRVGASGAVNPPPFIALMGLLITETRGAFDRMVAMYSGDLAVLPSGWYEANGGGGCDCQDRIVCGAGGGLELGETGGDQNPVTLYTSSGIKIVTHQHNGSQSGYQASTNKGSHGSWAWSHEHAWQATLNRLIKRYGLSHIEYRKAA